MHIAKVMEPFRTVAIGLSTGVVQGWGEGVLEERTRGQGRLQMQRLRVL